MSIKLLLLDFDCTLTATHTSGALCFSNTAYDRHLPVAYDQYEEALFSSNIAAQDARFLFLTLMKWVESNICVSIVTMADTNHGIARQRQLINDLSQRYEVLAGRNLVIRWLCCIAMRAYNNCYEEAAVALRSLFATRRFHIVAKYNAQSKREHFISSVSFFQDARVLDCDTLQPQQVLYIDDTMSLLADMQKHVPNIQTFWTPRGLDKAMLEQISLRFQIPLATLSSAETQ